MLTDYQLLTHRTLFPSAKNHETLCSLSEECNGVQLPKFDRRPDNEFDAKEVALDCDRESIEGIFQAWMDEEILYQGKPVDEIVVVGQNEYLPCFRGSSYGKFITLEELRRDVVIIQKNTITL